MSQDNSMWHVTDDESEVPVRIKKKSSTRAQQVSRRPAAIAGIVMVTVIGSIITFQPDDFVGQVTPPTTNVRITNSGLEPQVLTASPGDTITWINEQDIPHYLVSDSLCVNGGTDCMTTGTVFSGEEVSYTIPIGVGNGAYTYFSPTDTNVIGTISIGGSNNPVPSTTQTQEQTCYSPSDCVTPEYCTSLVDGIVPGICTTQQPAQASTVVAQSNQSSSTASMSNQQSSQSSVEEIISEEVPTNPLLESIRRQLELDGGATASTTTPPSGSTNNTTAIAGIPQNPYTVNSTNTNPGITGGIPSSALISQTQMPFYQPSTGLSTWMIALVTSLSLWVVVKLAAKHRIHQ